VSPGRAQACLVRRPASLRHMPGCWPSSVPTRSAPTVPGSPSA